MSLDWVTYSRPMSVAGLITDAGATLAVEGNVRRQLINGRWEPMDGTPTVLHQCVGCAFLPRVLAKLEPT